MRLAITIAIVFTCAVSSVLSGKPMGKREWERLSRPPHDSVQARDTRIWFGPQYQGKCRTQIEILDSSKSVVRHITDEMLGKGYYNLYWDKKDDSGQFVPKGLYYYRIQSGCMPELLRKLWASYRPFERVVRMTIDTADLEASATIVVDTPAARLSLDVFGLAGQLIDSLCPDTVLHAGSHRIVWRPSFHAALGEYYLRMKVEDYITEEKIRLR